MPPTYSLVPGGSDIESSRGFTNLTILDQPQVPCAVVKADGIAMSALSTFFDPVFRGLPAALEQAGRSIVAPAIAAYFRIGGIDEEQATTDLLAGFPIDAPLGQELRIGTVDGGSGFTAVPWAIPGGRIAVLTHHGAYSGLQASWQRALSSMTERGLSPVPPFWEVYVTPPAPGADPAALRTDLFVALGSRPGSGPG